MSLKSRVEEMAGDVSGQVEHLPDRAEEARKMVNEFTEDLADRAMIRSGGKVTEFIMRTLVVQ